MSVGGEREQRVGAAAAVADLARAGLKQEQAPQLDPVQLELAVECFRIADKYHRALHTYDQNHPSLLRFLDDLQARLHEYVDLFDDLRVTVHPTSLAVDGQIVHATPRIDENIWFPLFGDGIRQLSFTGGLNRDDLVRFFDILTEIGDGKALGEIGEDDSVTLLWEADLAGVEFVAVSTFAEGREDRDNAALAAVREMINLSMMKELSGAALTGTAFDAGEIARRMHSISLSSADLMFLEADNLGALAELPTTTREVLVRLFQIDQAARAEFASGCAHIEGLIDRYLAAAVAALDHVLAPVDAAALLVRLAQFFEAVVLDDQLTVAYRLLTATNSALARRFRQDLSAALDTALREPLVTPAAARALAEALAQAEEPLVRQRILELLAAIPSSAAGEVARLYARITDDPTRLELRRLLIRHGNYAVEGVAEILPGCDEQLARELIQLLAEVGTERALEALDVTTDHRIPRIAAEALNLYLSGAPLATAGARAHKALSAAEPLLRRVGCHFIGRAKPAGAKRWLEERFAQPGYADLELAEKQRLFLAYAAVGGTGVVPWLRERLTQRNLFGKSSIDHDRIAAALTLAQLRAVDARPDIERLASARLTRGQVKEACTRALALLDAADTAPTDEFDQAPLTGARPVSVPAAESPPPPAAAAQPPARPVVSAESSPRPVTIAESPARTITIAEPAAGSTLPGQPGAGAPFLTFRAPGAAPPKPTRQAPAGAPPPRRTPSPPRPAPVEPPAEPRSPSPVQPVDPPPDPADAGGVEDLLRAYLDDDHD